MKDNFRQYVTGTTLLVAVCSAGVWAGPVFSFTGITHNSAVNTQIGQTQLSVEVQDAGAGQVRFIFHNSGPAASTITQIYYDNGPGGPLASIVGFDYSNPGIAFTVGAVPSNVPGWNNVTPNFQATAGLTAGAADPAPHNGVNPFEWVGITTNPAVPYTYADVLDQISSGALRIGIHVQSFANGGSESFVTTWNRPPIVPAPGSLLLTTIGLGAVRLVRNRYVLT